MNTKKKLLFSFAGLILSIVVFSTVVFAWFAISSATSEFIIESGNFEVDTKLYHAKAQYTYNTETSSDELTSYTYTEVDSAKVATKLFENIIPGQIITLQLEVTNLDTSSLPANYEFDFGNLYYGESNKTNGSYDDSNYSLITSAGDLTSDKNNQHFLYAIHYIVEKVTTEAHVDGAHALTVDQIQGVSIANTDCSAVDAAKDLISKLSDSNPLATGTLEKGQTDVYIIKFYFEPTYGDPDSNEFRNKAFKYDSIVVSYTQEEKITE